MGRFFLGEPLKFFLNTHNWPKIKPSPQYIFNLINAALCYLHTLIHHYLTPVFASGRKYHFVWIASRSCYLLRHLLFA